MLHQEKKKFNHTFQQLEESHCEIRQQEKSSYEKKINEIRLDMKKKRSNNANQIRKAN